MWLVCLPATCGVEGVKELGVTEMHFVGGDSNNVPCLGHVRIMPLNRRRSATYHIACASPSLVRSISRRAMLRSKPHIDKSSLHQAVRTDLSGWYDGD